MNVPLLRSTLGAIVVGFAVCACATATNYAPVFVVPNEPSSPFSGVVRVDHLLFVSGQIGIDADSVTKPVVSRTARETARALDHIQALLVTAGSSLDRVARCTVMLADMKDWQEMNQAYDSYFPKHRPARSSFGATGLALGARVEIECIATVD